MTVYVRVMVYSIFIWLLPFVNKQNTEGRRIAKRAGCTTSPKYDIRCHGTCPGVGSRDWVKNSVYEHCNSIKTYHCAFDDITGQPVDACLVPDFCDEGEEPVFIFPEGKAKVRCRPCKNVEKVFNSRRRRTDSFSECFESRIPCKSYLGEIECNKPTGKEIYYTQTNCSCNLTGGFIPDSTDGPYCSENIKCLYRPCENSADGKKQERLSDFTCRSVCDKGFERIDDSVECLPIPDKSCYKSQVHVTLSLQVQFLSRFEAHDHPKKFVLKEDANTDIKHFYHMFDAVGMK